MSEIPTDLKYSLEHEWLRQEDGTVCVGITAHAQQQLGDIVNVELPKVGDKVAAGKTIAVVDSVKAASDIYAPVSGSVVEVNASLYDQPELVNVDPYGEGWLVRMEMSDSSELEGLLDAEGYQALLASEAE